MTIRSSRRFIARAVLAGILLAVLVVTLWGLAQVGHFLVVADPPAASDAIAMLDGGPPMREIEAAALYHRGFAPRILVSNARSPFSDVTRRLMQTGLPQDGSVDILRHLHVPEAAIVRLDRQVENTHQELAVDFEYAKSHGFRRLIIVTSPYHTRRVRVIWNARYQAVVPALVEPAAWERYDADRWWRSRRNLEFTLHELVGIAHFWIGSPIPTFDPR